MRLSFCRGWRLSSSKANRGLWQGEPTSNGRLKLLTNERPNKSSAPRRLYTGRASRRPPKVG